MSTFIVPVALTIPTPVPAPGIIPVGRYSIGADFSALPAGFMSVDSTGHFTARFQRRNGRISGPLSPGDKIDFVFGVTQPAGMSVSGLAKPGPNVLAWTTTVNNANGTVTLTGVVTGGAVGAGAHHSEYDISLQQGGSRWTIDPDFETDVSDA